MIENGHYYVHNPVGPLRSMRTSRFPHPMKNGIPFRPASRASLPRSLLSVFPTILSHTIIHPIRLSSFLTPQTLTIYHFRVQWCLHCLGLDKTFIVLDFSSLRLQSHNHLNFSIQTTLSPTMMLQQSDPPGNIWKKLHRSQSSKSNRRKSMPTRERSGHTSTMARPGTPRLDLLLNSKKPSNKSAGEYSIPRTVSTSSCTESDDDSRRVG